MSPEIIDGQDKTKMSDFWALGVLIHLMFYRKFPFEKKTKGDLFFNILNGNIISERKRKAPKSLRKLIIQLLTVNH